MTDITSIIVDSILSLLAIVVSVVVFAKTVIDNKQSLELALFSNIQQTKSNVDNALFNLSLMDNISDNMNIRPLCEDYLTALCVACDFYICNGINKKRFMRMYKSDILSVFDNFLYYDIIRKSLGSYQPLVIVRDKIKAKHI